MRPRARTITPERLDRLMRWSQAWLLRLAAWIVEAAGLVAPLERALTRQLKPKLDWLARGICMLIAAKAVLRLNRRKRHAGGKPQTAREGVIRAMIGAHLRKRVRARDLRAKIAALLMLLQNAEKHIARLTRRLRCGLNRRCGGLVLSSCEANAPSVATPALLIPDCNSS